jgi:K+-transporting ATPase ATPase B chain
MTTRKRYIKLFDPELVGVSIKQSFVKLNPVVMIKNPVMFTVEIVTAVMLAVCIYQAATGDTSQGALWYNIVVFLILLVTVLFANFAEALAEARGKAQAESLRKTREETPAKENDGQWNQSHSIIPAWVG